MCVKEHECVCESNKNMCERNKNVSEKKLFQSVYTHLNYNPLIIGMITLPCALYRPHSRPHRPPTAIETPLGKHHQGSPLSPPVHLLLSVNKVYKTLNTNSKKMIFNITSTRLRN